MQVQSIATKQLGLEHLFLQLTFCLVQSITRYNLISYKIAYVAMRKMPNFQNYL